MLASIRRPCSLALFASLLGACGGHQPEPLPGGGWRVQCIDTVERCLNEAQRVCGKEGYRVLGGNKEKKKFGSDQGYQTGTELYTFDFGCGEAGATETPPPEKPAAATAASKPKKPAHLCTPGMTQRCVGPGACEGGQSCNAEGTGFLPCDCGPPREAAPPEPGEALTPAPAGSAAPSSPATTAPANPPR